MKAVGYITAFIGGLVAAYLLVSLGVVDAIDGLPGVQEEPGISLPTYLSFVSVMLTAVTVVLAAVAIGIGVVAAYTFQGIKSVAHQIAEDTSKVVAGEELSEVKIRQLVFELYAAATSKPEVQTELKEGFDPSDSGER